MEMNRLSAGLRRAVSTDVDAITRCVRSAYARYADRLPVPPEPVLVDYAKVVRETATWLLEQDSVCIGVVVLVPKSDHLFIENVAVAPEHQGQGLGHRLMEFAEAEARRAGLDELRLYTHALMTENLALYRRLGYVEIDRRTVDGRDRVFMIKRLAT